MSHVLLTTEQAQQIEEAFENAESVAASINAGKHHVIQIDDEKCFWQREEWVRWAIDEVLPEIREALSAIRAARAQEGTVRGFSLWLDREAWGHIIDGLMLERERSDQRKAANPESNSNIIVGRCAELITQINDAGATIRAARAQEQAEQEPVRKRCKRCNDTGFVSDGEIDNIGGEQLEVPIECVKDCPDCASPVRTKDLTDDEIKQVWLDGRRELGEIGFARAIEARIKEKNRA